MPFVYHLVEPDTWAAAMTSGRYAPDSLADEGFIHLSFAHQLTTSANRYYATAGRLLAIVFDTVALGTDLVVEDTSGHGKFPHLYRAIDPTEAVEVVELQRVDGVWAELDRAPQS